MKKFPSIAKTNFTYYISQLIAIKATSIHETLPISKE